MKQRKLLVTVLAAALALGVAGTAAAQHGGGGHGGGGWSGGGHGGGGWSGGGHGWSGGGWHGGSGWHGGGWHGNGWHGSWGVWIGVPGAWWGWPAYYPYYGYYGYPYYGYPYYTASPGYVDYGPPVYIQRDPAPAEVAPPATQGQGQYTYYYCSDPAGYYPQVSNCNRPWTKVVPNSPPPAPMPQ